MTERVGRLLGIDLGERRIGLAVGDPATGTTRPVGILRRGRIEQDAERIVRIAGEHGATELVVGLPLHLDGREGPQAATTRGWADAIRARTGLPVAYRDERFTSEVAEALLGRTRRGSSGGPPSPAARSARRAAVDSRAAAAIVQSELDARTEVRG